MNIKSLLLGSAAALVAVSGARAADAVVIAEPEPMEYVRICDTYGVGFYYIPGTETCLKVSGYMRYDIGIGDTAYGGISSIDKRDFLEAISGGAFGDVDLDNDTYYKRARFQLRTDARTETELGTLRVYAAINFNYDVDDNGVSILGVRPTSDILGFGVSDAYDNVGIEHAYIELGGFRVGKTDSLFSTFTGYAGGVIADDMIGYGPFGTHQIAYTFNGGNGFTAAVALEEGDGDVELFPGLVSANAYTIDSYVPHVVAGIGWTGGWGGISAVVGYDSVWEEVAGKVRLDFNASDAISLFVMVGGKSSEDYTTTISGVPITYSPNYYGNWGGDWAIWGGGTFKATEQATFNLQISYDETENFAVAANVAYELVPNFVVTPEITYQDNFDVDDSDAWGGFLRMQANFGG